MRKLRTAQNVSSAKNMGPLAPYRTRRLKLLGVRLRVRAVVFCAALLLFTLAVNQVNKSQSRIDERTLRRERRRRARLLDKTNSSTLKHDRILRRRADENELTVSGMETKTSEQRLGKPKQSNVPKKQPEQEQEQESEPDAKKIAAAVPPQPHRTPKEKQPAPDVKSPPSSEEAKERVQVETKSKSDEKSQQTQSRSQSEPQAKTRPQSQTGTVMDSTRATAPKVVQGADSKNPTSELEIYWDDDAPLTRICRIRRACIAKDGAVVVPLWMKSRIESLEACGLYTIRTMKSENDWDSSTVATYADFDLFGILPVRYHIPHFATDLLPFLYTSEVLRPAFSKLHTKRRVCYREGNTECPRHRAKERLNIALYTENRVASMQSDEWVPILAAMIPERPYLAFPEAIFKDNTATAAAAATDLACFRSVVGYSPHSYIRPWRGWYGPKQPLFAKNNISRNSVLRNPDKNGVCKVQLTVLNRFGWIRRAGYLVGRDITNVEEIMTELENGLKIRQGRLALDVAAEYFEAKEFREQVAIVQKADVILGVHGAGLGNLLFARLDAPFVEVFPFGYYAGPFDKLAEALNLKYRYVVAEPDTENFYECLRKRANQTENPEVETKGRQVWNNAVKEWEGGDIRVLNSHEFKSELLTPIKLCARSQRMKLRAKHTAKLLLDLADGICRRRENGRGP